MMDDIPHVDEVRAVFMKCPYPDELCIAPATLSDLEFPVDEGWVAWLWCANGHRFRIGQPEGDEV